MPLNSHKVSTSKAVLQNFQVCLCLSESRLVTFAEVLQTDSCLVSKSDSGTVKEVQSNTRFQRWVEVQGTVTELIVLHGVLAWQPSRGIHYALAQGTC